MCPGCYKPDIEGYCLDCRKRLFNGKKVSSILNFENPKDENFKMYSEKTKRLSISGVQLKYSLKLEGNELVLTDQGGQFIIKPIPPSVEIKLNEQAPENEHLTMQIASQIFGLKTAENALIFFKDGKPAYITKRFDLKPGGGKYLQEDLAQILGKTKDNSGENFKYQGAYEDIGVAIKKYVPAYLPNVERFFELVLFNFIFSNGDAHLKNFSLVESSGFGDVELSKAYDLMCTEIHTPNEFETALNLYEGEEDNEFYAINGGYGQVHFRELAHRLGIKPLRTDRIIYRLLSHHEKVNKMIDNSFLSQEVKSLYKAAYTARLNRMGVTEEIIAKKLGIEKKADFPGNRNVKITMHRGLQLEGTLTAALGDNKYAFTQSKPPVENPATTIDGDMMLSVEPLG